MADYKEIRGFNVQSKSTDPTPYAQALVDNPYAGTWASGGALNTAKSRMGAFGIQTAGVVAGGEPTPANDQTEEYDGSSWTEVNELNTGRLDLGGGGFSSSQAIAFGGATTPNSENETETWNGTSWTEQSELATASRYMGNSSNGGAANAICFGGSSTGPSQNETTTQEWTASATLSTVTSS